MTAVVESRVRSLALLRQHPPHGIVRRVSTGPQPVNGGPVSAASTGHFEGDNISGWRNGENDRLLDQIAEELDTPRRIQLLRRQQEIWAEDLPAIPLWYLLTLSAAKKTLRNVRPNIYGGILWKPEHWEWAE